MEIRSRNLYRLTRFVLLKLPYLFCLLAYLRPVRKRLLIIKPDAIGDYVLFRNFIEEVKNSSKYKGYEIHLLGNTIWADLARHVDGTFVSRFLFAKPNSMYYSPRDVLKLGWQLFRAGYQVVLNPNSTRTFITDGMAGLSAAPQIIGYQSNTEGIPEKFKRKTDKFYTKLLELPANINFEFHRHCFYFEQVLGKCANIKQPILPFLTEQRNGIVIIPAAGLNKRALEAQKFVDLISNILTYTSAKVYLAGAQSDLTLNDSIAAQFSTPQLVNITGKTTLTELAMRIASASLVVANDSGAIHLAAATQTPSVCIVGGGHFSRFVPYPADIVYSPFCVFNKMECYYCNWNCIYTTVKGEAFPCIQSVSTEQVWQAVKPLLPQQ